MADIKASKDRQEKCRCGKTAIDLINVNYRLKERIERLNLENIAGQVESLKASISVLYDETNKVAERCNLDVGIEQNYALEAFGRIDDMKTKNLETFTLNKNIVLDNISAIRNGITEKIGECSR